MHRPLSLAQRCAAVSPNGCGGILGEEDMLRCGYVGGRLGLHTPLSSMRTLLHSYLRNAGKSTSLKLFTVELDLVGETSAQSHPMYPASDTAARSSTRTVSLIMFSSLELGFRANAAWDQAKRFESSSSESAVPTARSRSASVTEMLASGVAAAVGAESHEGHPAAEAFRDDVLVSSERIEEYRKTKRHLTPPLRLSAAAPRDDVGSFEPSDVKEVLKS